jgi:hypothetical protein
MVAWLVCLDLLCAPASVTVTHIGRRFDGWEEFHGSVGDTDEDDDATGDVVDGPALKAQATDQDIDCGLC